MINRTFLGKDKDLIPQLYKSFIKHRLECCIQPWRPYLKKIYTFWKKGAKNSYETDFRLFRLSYEERLKIGSN